MPKQYEAMRDKFASGGMDYAAAQGKAARIFNAKHPTNPVGRHMKQEKEDQKKKRAEQTAKLKKLAGGKKGEQGTGKIDMSKQFVPKKNKAIPTMEEVLKKEREKKKKKKTSWNFGKRGRDEITASTLGNRRRA